MVWRTGMGIERRVPLLSPVGRHGVGTGDTIRCRERKHVLLPFPRAVRLDPALLRKGNHRVSVLAQPAASTPTRRQQAGLQGGSSGAQLASVAEILRRAAAFRRRDVSSRSRCPCLSEELPAGVRQCTPLLVPHGWISLPVKLSFLMSPNPSVSWFP